MSAALHLTDSPLSTLRVRIEVSTTKGAISHISLCEAPTLTCPPILSSWLEAYMHGEHTLPPLHWPSLPPFTRQILEKIAAIPFGKTTTYSDLDPAARAVGTVCNKNPFPLVIPCHRVLAKHGPGGYAFGLPLKQHLLAFENSIG